METIIKVGTRESILAVTQSKWVINKIKEKYPYLKFKLIEIKTKGDMVLDKRLEKIGGKGLFIKELEHALLNKSIDFAVHSMKDIPAEIPDSLSIEIVSEREDPRDVLVTLDGKKLKDLPKQAVIGTSSLRREIQLLRIRPDLRCKMLRGNVLTRLDKLTNHEYDGLILAAAGLKRLGLEGKCSQYFEVEEMIPSSGQGILCVETRKGEEMDYLIESVYSKESAAVIKAERAFMIRLNGGCTTPISAHGILEKDKIKIYGMLADREKTYLLRDYIEGDKEEAYELGIRLAEKLLKQVP